MPKKRKRKPLYQPPPPPEPAPRPLYFLLAPVILSVLVLLTYKSDDAENKLIPISVIAMITGVIFEYRALCGKGWKTILHSLLAFFISLLAFLPFKHEHRYHLEDHATVWPYAFIICMGFVAILYERKKVTMQLNEGVTLVQSLAVIYWVVDYGFFKNAGVLLSIFMIGGLLFAIYSLYHALTPVPHTRKSRLTLSIWSAFIFLLFLADNFYRVHQNNLIEETTDLADGLFIALQYFLLGVSGIYAVQNILMLMNFLPGKGEFFNEAYYHRVKELKDEHINRYSENQMRTVQALICICIAAAIFTLNYFYDYLPRNMAIWAAFALFSFLRFNSKQLS